MTAGVRGGRVLDWGWIERPHTRPARVSHFSVTLSVEVGKKGDDRGGGGWWESVRLGMDGASTYSPCKSKSL